MVVLERPARATQWASRALRDAVVLALVGCGTPPSPAAPSTDAKPASPPPTAVQGGEVTAPAVAKDAEPSRALVALLVEAQRAYLERGDTAPFSALLLPDAEVRAGRTKEPDSFDSVFGKEQLDGIYQWAARNEGRYSAAFAMVDIRRSPDAAVVELQLDCTKNPEDKSSFGQRFELVRRSGAWRIARFRYWPLIPETGEDFGRFFAETDARIEEDLRTGDLRNAAYHMMLAYRFKECAALTRRLTTDQPKDAWAWELRAKASALVGDGKDADESSELARSLAQGAE